MKKTISLISFLMILVLMLASCTGTSGGNNPTTEETQEPTFQIKELVGTPSDYSDNNNWLNIPEITHEVDTFYIYPTAYSNPDPNAPSIVPIEDETMREGAQYNFGLYGDTYSQSTNVFVPYYRQTNLYAYADMDADSILDFQMQEQRTDIYAALDYYFAHYNKGRPFILAGHSQGSMMVRIVVREYMQAHPEYYKNMVAAYVLGFSVTKDDYTYNPNLKFAEGADDTGVVVSWNIEGPGNKDQKNIVVCKNAISINPINWKTDDTYAPAEDNLGTYITDPVTGELRSSPVKADAQVDAERGVVICNVKELPFVSDFSPSAAIYFGPESYHNGDYLFYLDNLKENVKLRSQRFLEEHKAN